MGFWDRFRRTSSNKNANIDRPSDSRRMLAVAATDEEYPRQIQAFDFSNISSRGDLSGFDYTSILKDKQGNITNLYRLADYYVDADEIIHGIIKHVCVPYSTCSPWQLLDVNEKTRKIYEEKYRSINLREKIDSIMLQYWKYSNVVVYYMDGNIITLPIHKCKIGSVSLNGDPLVDFDCQSVYMEWRNKGYTVKENWIKENKIETYFKGFPPEIRKTLNSGEQYAQLNPDNTFVLQDSKEDWMRYSINFIAACLPSLAKKALISQYEDAMLNIGMRSLVHVKYGDVSAKGSDILTNMDELKSIQKAFQKAMNGFPLVVTNALANADILQADMGHLFEWKKYDDVNTAILSAGGISGILVTGVSNDGSTFASAQVSMQTAAVRIDAARTEFCKMMTRINKRILEDLKEERSYNLKQAPTFSFMPLDMEGQKALRNTCKELWEKGVVSTKTMMDMHGYSIEHEKETREKEITDGTDETLRDRKEQAAEKAAAASPSTENNEPPSKGGRPEMTNDERTSDPADAARGKQPKPSNPEGSMGDSSS